MVGFSVLCKNKACQLQTMTQKASHAAQLTFSLGLRSIDKIQSSQSIPTLGARACHELAKLTVALSRKQRLCTVGTDHTMLISGLLHQHTAAVTAHNLSAQLAYGDIRPSLPRPST